MSDSTILKKDLFGEIRLSSHSGEAVVVRDSAAAATGLGWLARRLLHREASALAMLEDIEGFAQVLRLERDWLMRSFLDGEPMQRCKPTDPAYFKYAARLVRKMHRAGVVHNDLAKEPNFIVQANRKPALVDIQIAWSSPNRGKLFRLAAREDLRHLLKHKRTYCPQQLTSRERTILATPGFVALAWSKTLKPVYQFITRRILGWADREGAGDRGERP
jgi:RIO-like serine/threonine protein kinase